MRFAILGLSLSSSWGNGHATTFRALVRGLSRLGHQVLFLERDVPWYAANRDLPDPGFCELALYADLDDLKRRFAGRVAASDAVIVGSYVPDGIAVLDWVLRRAGGVRAFYDIDTPVTVAALGRGDCAYLAAGQIPGLDLYLSFTGGPMLADLGRRFGAVRAAALHCAVDEALYRPVPVAPAWELGYLGTYSPDRQPALERLLLDVARRLPDRRFVVAGPQYPATIAWPANVDRIEHLPPADHAGFYSRLRWTLNVTRADMVRAGWSPSVRLFEAAACATPILSDRWPGLTELLPEGEAIVVADDTGDAIEALAMPEAARARLGRAARSIVLARHTGTARARELVALVAAAAEQTAPAAVGP